MNATAPVPGFPFGRAVAVHSLGWLAAANLAGVWLAVCLLWPAVGNALAPLTYGRWMPLHLDWQLYGWCSLPAVGALLAWYVEARHPLARRHAHLALAGWSLALGLGGVAWLNGVVSGKLFLDWHGWARPLLPVAMQVLWAVLALHAAWRWPRWSPAQRTLRAGVLALLFAVPWLLFWSAGRGVYQSVNPDSGGATGASLLGSTLGIVTIFMLVPQFLGLEARRSVRWFWRTLGASWLAYAAIDRGDASHHATAQIVALGTLLAWVPLLPLFWRRYAWPAATRPWLRAAGAWWALLVVTGWISFLPGISETLKFTHAFVAHAHLAMAGLITSVNAAVLVVLAGRATPRGVFWLWQGGCAIHVAAVAMLGVLEAESVAELYRSEPWTQALFAARLIGGVAMAGASVRWLAGVFRA